MKVGTDAVLIGAAVTLRGNDRSILDAGTGTGTIALMIAQRLSDMGADFRITGIDIDAPSAAEAALNAAASPWTENIDIQHISLQECDGIFDLIVSNPPFYDSTLPNPDGRRNTARHTAEEDCENRGDAAMSYRTLMEFAKGHLAPGGRLSMVLPTDRKADVLRYGRMCGLHPFRILRIRTVERKAPLRMVIELAAERCEPIIGELVMQENGRYTQEYTDLVKDFYLWA